MSDGMIFNLGLPKTGTTTLARALRRAGLRVADWRIRRGQTDPALEGQLVGRILYEDWFASGDPLARLGDFGAVAEASAMVPPRSILWPQTDWALIDAIRTRHPGTRFLLTRRDPVETALSMRNWRGLGTERLPRHSVPGLPPGFGESTEELARWIDGHARMIGALFAGDPMFLGLDVAEEDARDRLAAFLGRDMPWWGRSNRNRADHAAAAEGG